MFWFYLLCEFAWGALNGTLSAYMIKHNPFMYLMIWPLKGIFSGIIAAYVAEIGKVESDFAITAFVTGVILFFIIFYFGGNLKRRLKKKRSAAKEKLLAKVRELHPLPKPAATPA